MSNARDTFFLVFTEQTDYAAPRPLPSTHTHTRACTPRSCGVQTTDAVLYLLQPVAINLPFLAACPTSALFLCEAATRRGKSYSSDFLGDGFLERAGGEKKFQPAT